MGHRVRVCLRLSVVVLFRSLCVGVCCGICAPCPGGIASCILYEMKLTVMKFNVLFALFYFSVGGKVKRTFLEAKWRPR